MRWDNLPRSRTDSCVEDSTDGSKRNPIGCV